LRANTGCEIRLRGRALQIQRHCARIGDSEDGGDISEESKMQDVMTEFVQNQPKQRHQASQDKANPNQIRDSEETRWA
jgi:hypothetical protein